MKFCVLPPAGIIPPPIQTDSYTVRFLRIGDIWTEHRRTLERALQVVKTKERLALALEMPLAAPAPQV